jgi:hypothetical protein
MISFLCGDPVISKINVRGYISGTILGDSECLKNISDVTNHQTTFFLDVNESPDDQT